MFYLLVLGILSPKLAVGNLEASKQISSNRNSLNCINVLENRLCILDEHIGGN